MNTPKNVSILTVARILLNRHPVFKTPTLLSRQERKLILQGLIWGRWFTVYPNEYDGECPPLWEIVPEGSGLPYSDFFVSVRTFDLFREVILRKGILMGERGALSLDHWETVVKEAQNLNLFRGDFVVYFSAYGCRIGEF